MAQSGGVVRRAAPRGYLPAVGRKKGAIERLYTEPPDSSVAVCLDEMGQVSARSYSGSKPVRALPDGAGHAPRARQEIDYNRRGRGYKYGAFRPATGGAYTREYGGRTTAAWVDFLGEVDG